MEHRWGQRMAVNFTARIGADSTSRHLARVTNVSISGAFLKIGLPVDDLHPVVIEIPSAASRRARTAVEAYVVRRTEEGVGIEWANLAPEPVMQLIAALRPASAPVVGEGVSLAQSG